jgi:hypothetical protein
MKGDPAHRPFPREIPARKTPVDPLRLRLSRSFELPDANPGHGQKVVLGQKSSNLTNRHTAPPDDAAKRNHLGYDLLKEGSPASWVDLVRLCHKW